VAQELTDLGAYLRRIGVARPAAPGAALLDALQEAHLRAIPFENADVRLGRPVDVSLPALEAKLVGAGRGGYCFEQNTLFGAALASLGFPVRPLEARVRPPGADAPLPRTHLVLAVDTEAGVRLADVGFGADGPLRSVPMDGSLSRQPGATHRIATQGELRVLQTLRAGAWADLYAFGLEPVLPVDVVVANWFTSTWPRSPFVLGFTAQWSLAEARHALRGLTYTLRRGDAEETRELDEDEAVRLVRETFGLRLSPDEVRSALRGR
jgi:N-hydroxyarylamine O-acetyltransferase